jgi:hypothetical protein
MLSARERESTPLRFRSFLTEDECGDSVCCVKIYFREDTVWVGVKGENKERGKSAHVSKDRYGTLNDKHCLLRQGMHLV